MKNLLFRAGAKLQRTWFTGLERFGCVPGKKDLPSALAAGLLLPNDIFDDSFSQKFQHAHPAETREILTTAESVITLGQTEIPWHRDPRSGHRWNPKTFYADIRYGRPPGADVKGPWELSRCQHLLVLGQAYRLTGDEKYAEAFVHHISDWIEKNPVRRGVNWVSPMEAALRAFSWLFVREFFRGSPRLTADFEKKLIASLHDHGMQIDRHIEHGGQSSTNHYLANLLGLAIIGQALSRTDWISFAHVEWQKEILEQTYDDGFAYEASTAYHRLDTEMAFFMLRLFEKSNLPIEPFVRDRVHKMFGVVSRLCDAAGLVPLIGDNDSGRICTLRRREDADQRYLLAWGATLFNDGALKMPFDADASDVLWLFGFSGMAVHQNLSTKGPAEPEKQIRQA
jgi:hypothetical protein